MATQKFKLAINNAKFPFLYSRAGRSIAQPGLDVAPRTSVAFVGGVESFDYNMIQVLYAENVLPSAEGFISVSTEATLPAISPVVTDFDRFMILRDSQERNYLFVPARGKNYVYDTTTSAWVSRTPFAWSALRSIVSSAYVDGRTFVFYEGDRLIEWNVGSSIFDTRALTLPAGYAIGDIRCVCGASNYLILATSTRIFWNSALNIFDFADPIGKAGNQIPIDLKGQITALAPMAGGFIIYTSRNAVAAFFTNNPDAPFSFREIQGAGGVADYEQITADANEAAHYIYGSSGLQVLNLQKAEQVHPDCADFLAGKQFESWNATTKKVEETTLLEALEVKLQYLGNRYLVLSYGKVNGQFTYALFFDDALKRWGKVRCDHVDIGIMPRSVVASIPLKYSELTASYDSYTMGYDELFTSYGAVLPLRAGFAFLQKDGTVKSLVSDSAVAVGDGVLVIGHIQVVRGRTITFATAVLEGVYSTPAPAVNILGSLPTNGFNREEVYAPMLVATNGNSVQYGGRKTYENFDIAIEGKFTLSSALVETTIHGSR